MCDIISNQSEPDYACSTRAVRLNGHATSVRLENYFWRALDAIALRERMSTSRLLCKLSDEIAALRGRAPANFASLLRVGCIKFVSRHPDILQDAPPAGSG